jgi:hypothetical protein
MKIISRKDALQLKLNRYFTGKECKNKHISERMTSTGRCIECHKIYGKRFRTKLSNKTIKLNSDNRILCQYGCDEIAKYQLKNGKWCCSYSNNKCVGIRLKNSNGLRKAHKEGRLSTVHFTFDTRSKASKGKRFCREEYFSVHENPKRHRCTIKSKLIDERGYKCESCKLVEWLGKLIVLELEHINGNNKDNTRENLKLLCPNCHSQTPTWRRKK